jgi:hypothetical protein
MPRATPSSNTISQVGWLLVSTSRSRKWLVSCQKSICGQAAAGIGGFGEILDRQDMRHPLGGGGPALKLDLLNSGKVPEGLGLARMWGFWGP